MKTFTPSTGNRDLIPYLKRPADIIQVPVIVNDFNRPLLPGNRLYLPSVPIVQSSMTIGILSYSTNALRDSPEISTEVARPVNGVNVGQFGLDAYLYLTLCNAQGVELFKSIPYLSLIATLRKYKPYTGQICLFKSYFKVASGAPVFGSLQIANLQFFTVPIK